MNNELKQRWLNPRYITTCVNHALSPIQSNVSSKTTQAGNPKVIFKSGRRGLCLQVNLQRPLGPETQKWSLKAGGLCLQVNLTFKSLSGTNKMWFYPRVVFVYGWPLALVLLHIFVSVFNCIMNEKIKL